MRRRRDDLKWPPLVLWPSSAELKFLFGIQKSLRAFLNPFFTGEVVTVNCIYNSDRHLTFAVPSRENAFGAARRPRQTRNKNNLSANYAQSNAERIFNRPTPGKGDCSKVSYDTQGVLNN